MSLPLFLFLGISQLLPWSLLTSASPYFINRFGVHAIAIIANAYLAGAWAVTILNLAYSEYKKRRPRRHIPILTDDENACQDQPADGEEEEQRILPPAVQEARSRQIGLGKTADEIIVTALITILASLSLILTGLIAIQAPLLGIHIAIATLLAASATFLQTSGFAIVNLTLHAKKNVQVMLIGQGIAGGLAATTQLISAIAFSASVAKPTAVFFILSTLIFLVSTILFVSLWKKVPQTQIHSHASDDSLDSRPLNVGTTLRKIGPNLAMLCLNFMVTLSLFPGVISVAQSSTNDSSRFYHDLFLPFLLFIFNIADMLGRCLPLPKIFYHQVLYFICRLTFYPILLCQNLSWASEPSHLPVTWYRNDTVLILSTILLALSGSWTTTGLIAQIPQQMTTWQEKSWCGTVTVVVINTGLILGSLLGYGIISLHS